jgi:UDP-N-acetylglucosamine 2-epimerase
MRVLIVGGPETTSLGDELEAAGVTVEKRADDPPRGGGPEEIAELATDLREFEEVLGDHGSDAALLASDSPTALAAVLVATKVGVPVARLRPTDGTADDGANARLIRQLADAALPPEPAAIVEWARDGYPARA